MKSQHHNRHAEVENHRAGIDLAARECSHLFDGGEITEQLPRLELTSRRMNETRPEKEKKRDGAEGNDRGDDLVLRQDRSEAADREIKHSEQQQHQIGAQIGAGRVRRGLMRDRLEDHEVKQSREPEDDVEDKAPKNFASTTCQSRTGAVMSGSIVPSLNSSAKAAS